MPHRHIHSANYGTKSNSCARWLTAAVAAVHILPNQQNSNRDCVYSLSVGAEYVTMYDTARKATNLTHIEIASYTAETRFFV